MPLETLSNKSTLVKLDWTNSFLLNGPLVSYHLFINNNSVYQGKSSLVVASIKPEECTFKKFTNQYGVTIRGYFNILNIELQVRTVYTNETIQQVKKPLNCTRTYIIFPRHFIFQIKLKFPFLYFSLSRIETDRIAHYSHLFSAVVRFYFVLGRFIEFNR